MAVSDVFHPRKLRLESGAERVRAWTGVDGGEVEIPPVPFPAEVREVVERRIWFGRQHVPGFQDILDQIPGLVGQFRLD